MTTSSHTTSRISDLLAVVIIGAFIGTITGFIGYIEGKGSVYQEAIRLNHAKKVVVWDGTNTPTVSIQWITNRPTSEESVSGNR